MNKKGFTLVELLAVVVILGILSTFIVPSVFKMVKNAKQDSYNVLVSSFEENARLYVSRHREEVESYLDTYNYFTITLTDLKDDNLLKTPIKDPRTDETIALTKKVFVVREENQNLSVCFEDNNCYAPITLASKVTDVSNVVTGTNEGLHQDTTNNFYYYAGPNPKNWVLFNDILWRIVKVNSDGSVKLIYEGTKEKNGTEQDGNISNRTFDDTSVNNYNSTTSIKTYLTNWYNTTLTAGNKAKVQAVNWCVGAVTYSTSGVSKASMLSGECATKTTATYTVGLLSASEYLYGSLDTGCTTSYKTSGDYGYACKNQNYLYKSFYNYFTLTRDNDATDVWPVNSTGSIGPVIPASNSMGTRPVIVLSNSAIIDRGDGTIDSPYTIRDIITADKTAPVITMLGDNAVVIKQGATYTDAGVTAADNVDGNVTTKVIKTSDLNPNVPGTYTVTYIVSDASGNKATKKRSIIVKSYTDYGLTFYLEADDFKNSPASTAWADKGGSNYIAAPTNFAYTTSSGSDGNGGIVLDGVNDYMLLSKDITTGNVDWTISIWVKTTSLLESYLLTNSSGGPVHNALKIFNGKIGYMNYRNETGWIQNYGSINIADGKWHMLTWVNYAGGTMDLYVDMTKDITLTNSAINTGNAGLMNIIGKYWGDMYYPGSLSDIRMYNRTLNVNEIGLVYNLNKR